MDMRTSATKRQPSPLNQAKIDLLDALLAKPRHELNDTETSLLQALVNDQKVLEMRDIPPTYRYLSLGCLY